VKFRFTYSDAVVARASLVGETFSLQSADARSTMASRPATTVERTYVSFYVPDVLGARGHDQVVLKHPNGLCVVCLSPEHPMCAAAGSSGGRAGDASAETAGKRKRDRDDEPGEGDAEARDASERASRAAAEPTASPAREARPDATSPDDKDDKRGVAPTTKREPGARESTNETNASPDALVSVDFSCGKDTGKDDGASVGAVFVSGKKKKGAKTLMENSGVCALIDSRSRRWTARACVRGKLLERNDALVRRPDLARTDPLGRGFLVILEPRPEDLERLRRDAMDKSAYDAHVAERKKSAATTT
jgi:glycine cleavage system H lipoate-binding protein